MAAKGVVLLLMMEDEWAEMEPDTLAAARKQPARDGSFDAKRFKAAPRDVSSCVSPFMAVLGTERSLCAPEMCLAAIAHCFAVNMQEESQLQGVPLSAIEVAVTGACDLRKVLDPQTAVPPCFHDCELVVTARTSRSADYAMDTGGNNPHARDAQSHPSARSSRANQASHLHGRMDVAAHALNDGKGTDYVHSIHRVFESAKMRVPACNTMSYGVPSQLRAHVVCVATSNLQGESCAGDASLDFSLSVSEDFEIDKQKIETEAASRVERARRLVLGQADLETSSAVFSLFLATDGDLQMREKEVDMRLTFPGFRVGTDRSFLREKPISFIASQSPSPGFPDGAAMQFGIARKVADSAKWPIAMTSLLDALHERLSVSICHRPDASRRGGVSVNHLRINSTSWWDACGPHNGGPNDLLARFYDMKCDVSINEGTEYLLDAEKRRLKKALETLYAASTASFIANSLTGDIRLEYVLRIDR
ncbi:hypothetical protein FVE85_6000 [Porphyridium purpureum]|uniref:Uncharacterized protein n=1 Tax=Porphyridium purpureum TaxID=35688 RepID=A0A5J4Z518_PORPP|nr:hypothetical protein FVE85_6000 [Porphyridium purpureum]|eukprot:POR4840..scf295_1